MKLTNETRKLLGAYSRINPNLLIHEGTNEIKTMSVEKNIFAKASVSEEFPVEVRFHDLGSFLSAFGTFADPDVTFEDKRVVLKERSDVDVMYYAEESVLTYPKKDLNEPEYAVDFYLTRDMLGRVLGALKIKKMDDIAISVDLEGVHFIICDRQNPSSDRRKITVDPTPRSEENTQEKQYLLRGESLMKLSGAVGSDLPMNYNVYLTPSDSKTLKVAKFVSDSKQAGDVSLTYWMALELDSIHVEV